MIEEAFQVRIK